MTEKHCIVHKACEIELKLNVRTGYPSFWTTLCSLILSLHKTTFSLGILTKLRNGPLVTTPRSTPVVLLWVMLKITGWSGLIPGTMYNWLWSWCILTATLLCEWEVKAAEVPPCVLLVSVTETDHRCVFCIYQHTLWGRAVTPQFLLEMRHKQQSHDCTVTLECKLQLLLPF